MGKGNSRMLGLSEIADRLGITSHAVRKWIVTGLLQDDGSRKRLKAIRAASSGMWRVKESDLEEFLTDNSTGAPVDS